MIVTWGRERERAKKMRRKSDVNNFHKFLFERRAREKRSKRNANVQTYHTLSNHKIWKIFYFFHFLAPGLHNVFFLIQKLNDQTNTFHNCASYRIVVRCRKSAAEIRAAREKLRKQKINENKEMYGWIKDYR